MTIADFAKAIESTGIATDLRESELAYPIVLSLHLTCLAFFGGLILATNLRLLGVAMVSTPAREVIARLRPWKRGGFVLMITLGLLLAACKASRYLANPYFLVKLSLLCMVGVHGLVFRRRVYATAGEPDSRVARTAAVLSILLWVSIVTMGRLIAYYEPPR
jgi:hypothetical protein